VLNLRRLLLMVAMVCVTLISTGSTAGQPGGVPELVSWDHTNTVGVGKCRYPKVSNDGRYVTFYSPRGHLLLPPEERHRLYSGYSLFMRDRVAQKTWLITYSRHQNGPLNFFIPFSPNDYDMSDDGRWVVFMTDASNVVPEDTNGKEDVFVWDRVFDSVHLVSRTWLGKPSNGRSYNPSIDEHGSAIVFNSGATNLVQLPGVWSGWNVFVARPNSYGDWRTKQIVTYPDRCFPSQCHGSPGGNSGPGPPQISADLVCYTGDDKHVLGTEWVNDIRLYCQDVSQRTPFNPAGVFSPIPGLGPLASTLRIQAVRSSHNMPSGGLVLVDQWNTDVLYSPLLGAPVSFDTPYGWGTVYPEIGGDIVVWTSLADLNGDGAGIFAQRTADIISSGNCTECRKRVSWGTNPDVSGNGEFITFLWPFVRGKSEEPPPPGVYEDVYILGRPLLNEDFRLQLIDPLRPGQRHLLDEDSPSYVKDEVEPLDRLFGSVRGMAADGQTRMIVYAEVPESGVLELSLREEGWEDATDWPRPRLSWLAAAEPADVTTTDSSGWEYQTIELQAQELPDGRWAAAGLIWAPAAFGSEPSLVEAISRPVDVRAIFTSNSGVASEESTHFKIVRPPVFLVHGIWSGPETWKYDFVRQENPRFPAYGLAAYPNDQHYYENVFRVRGQLVAFLDEIRSKGYAVTQAWGVGHSMGGQLLRRVVGRKLCLDGSCFRLHDRLTNYYSGDLYGFISVDSPHYGSELADLLLAMVEQRPWLDRFLCRVDRCPLGGAVNDLRVESRETRTVPELVLPTVPMVGTGGSEWLENRPLLPGIPSPLVGASPIDLIWNILYFYNRSASDFQSFVDSILGPDHDLLVGFASQTGGASAFSVFPYVDASATGMHTHVTGEERYGEKILDYLLGLEPGAFSQILLGYDPSSSALSSTAASGRRETSPVQRASAESVALTIVSPVAGTVFSPGDVLEVEVSPTAEPATTLFLVGTQSALFEDGSTTASFTVPEAHGPLPIAVVVIDVEGTEHVGEVEVVVQPAVALLNLLPEPTEMQLLEGDRSVPRVSGEYEDGSVRPLDPSLVSLTSQDPAIVTIEGDEIVAVAVGRTLVELSSDGVEALLPVEVTSCPEVGIPTVSASGSLCSTGAVSMTSSPGKSYLWSTGETTRSILVTEPGAYSVTTSVVGSCTATSAPIVVEEPAGECPEGEPDEPVDGDDPPGEDPPPPSPDETDDTDDPNAPPVGPPPTDPPPPTEDGRDGQPPGGGGGGEGGGGGDVDDGRDDP